MQHTKVTALTGGHDPEAPIREAYGYVADGYRRALRVAGLPQAEAACLRAVLRAVQQLAEQPLLSPEQSPLAGPLRSLQAG